MFALLLNGFKRLFMWAIGSLLLLAFNVLHCLITFPIRRKSKWIFRFFLAFVLFLAWLVPDGDKRFDTPAAKASLDHGYGLVSWEFENFFDKWFHKAWTVLPWTSTSEEDRRVKLERYSGLISELRTARDQLHKVSSFEVGDPNAVDDAQRKLNLLLIERDRIRDFVEEYLEQMITKILNSPDLNLFSSFVWPPVDFRIGDPPKLLVTSNRHEIVRLEDVLIDPDISVTDMEKIEKELISEHDVSAVVIQTGGLASYPNVVPTTDLKPLLEIAAHEWLHSHLIFYPLGQAYFSGGDIRSVNETLADIFGREVGNRVYSEVTGEPFVPLVRPETASNKKSNDDNHVVDAEKEEFSFNMFMALTRSKTDELLAQGEIEKAEAYMESRRVELLEHNYRIRKINQAYFAFHGTYAESPSAATPIARYLWDLRMQVGSVGDLVKLMRPIATYEEFEKLLVQRGIDLSE